MARLSDYARRLGKGGAPTSGNNGFYFPDRVEDEARRDLALVA